VTYREPRRLDQVLTRVVERMAPATTLARIQQCWEGVAGDTIATEATPISESSGVVTLACRSAVWANELQLMSQGLVEGLNGALGGSPVGSLRFVVRSPRRG
jgi:predicted nucleic acid-binding Zn ribbon protein